MLNLVILVWYTSKYSSRIPYRAEPVIIGTGPPGPGQRWAAEGSKAAPEGVLA